MPTRERKLVRIQERGQVTLPVAVRRKLGLQKGDLVFIEETAAGILLTPKGAAVDAPASRIAGVLQEKGLTLDDFLQASDATSTRLLKEALGLPADASAEAVSEHAKADFFAVVDDLRRRNQDKDPDEVYRDVTAAVEGVRRQRYEQRKA